MPAGRPTKCTTALLKKARRYLRNLPDGEVIHTLEGLSLYVGISRKVLHEWKNDPRKQEFRDICEELMSMQANELLNKGVSGEWNPTITKLILTKHDYSDKVENAHTGANGGPIQFSDMSEEQLEHIIKHGKPS